MPCVATPPIAGGVSAVRDGGAGAIASGTAWDGAAVAGDPGPFGAMGTGGSTFEDVDASESPAGMKVCGGVCPGAAVEVRIRPAGTQQSRK